MAFAERLLGVRDVRARRVVGGAPSTRSVVTMGCTVRRRSAPRSAVQARAEVAVRHRHMMIGMGDRGQLRPAAGTAGRSF